MPAVKFSDREKLLLLITAGVAVIYVFYQFLLLPRWDEIGQIRTKARAGRLELKVAESKIKILNAIGKHLGALPGKAELPKEEKALEGFKMLSQATVKSNLSVNFIKPLLDESGDGLKFNLACSGKYRNLYTFFSILYRLPTLILIDTMDITSGGGNSPDLNIKISLTVYN